MLPSRIFFDNFLDEFDTKKIDKMMKCDIYEENNMYHIEIDVPGYNKEDIKIEFDKGYLIIKAMHTDNDTSNRKYVRKERISMSKYERSFYFGDIDEDLIKAEFKDGILKVSVPKEKEQEISKKIINID